VQRLAADRRRKAWRCRFEIEHQLTRPGVRGDGDDTVAKSLEDAHEFVELVEADRLEMDLIVLTEADPTLAHNREEPEGIQGPYRTFDTRLGLDERCETSGKDRLSLSYCRFVRVLLWGAACLVCHGIAAFPVISDLLDLQQSG